MPKPRIRQGVYSEAGYGSRTRLSSLGSWHTTDVLILHVTIIELFPAECKETFQQVSAGTNL